MRALVLVCLLSTTAFADRRVFTSTREYDTMPEGSTSLQLWHTETQSSMQHALEIEHGITEHWDAAVYSTMSQLAGESLQFDGMTLESRYRFADRSEFPVDVMTYAGITKQFGDSIYIADARAVFARDVDHLTFALNAAAVVSFGRDVPDTTVDVQWAGGASYELHPKANIGVEAYGDDARASVGPALALAPSSNLWLAFTAGFDLSDRGLSGRLIVGIEL